MRSSLGGRHDLREVGVRGVRRPRLFGVRVRDADREMVAMTVRYTTNCDYCDKEQKRGDQSFIRIQIDRFTDTGHFVKSLHFCSYFHAAHWCDEQGIAERNKDS